MTRYLFILIVLSVFLVYTGCSKVDAPVVSDISPTINIAESDGGPSTLGVMGAYELNLDPDRMVADLTPMRSSAIGESYIVSGATFFTISPCPDCLKLKGIQLDPPYVKVIFSISHPFEKGDTAKPPTALNRLDLDIFDLALIVVPTDQTPVNYALTGASIYPDICGNADGYTRELEKVIGKTAACPYFLVVDNSETGTSTNNRFEMGTKNLEFGAWFKGGNFNLYLTMGYGASAKKPQRLHPTYYLPEFNRKAAWKVVVEQPASWSDSDSTTTNNVIVKVYDWQIGATVDPTLNDPTDIYASSNVAGVGVEIPGMFDELKTVTTPTGSHAGTPTDPLIYTIPIANENLLSEGTYTGIVKVLDTRTPPQSPTTGQIDSLVDAQFDGNYTTLEYKSMPEFAAYQIFTATVYESTPTGNLMWAKCAGGAEYDGITTLSDNSTVVTGPFSGTATFGPGEPNEIVLTSAGSHDIFIARYDSDGMLLWAKRAGGTNGECGFSITTLSDNSTVVTGEFYGSATFGQGEPNATTLTSDGYSDIFIARYNPDGTLEWAKRAGGVLYDEGYGITTLSDNSTVVTGLFVETATFGLGELNATTLTSDAGTEDIFIARYNHNGTLAWAKRAGGEGAEQGYGITVLTDNSTVVTGRFSSPTAIFGPGETNETTLYPTVDYIYDIFTAKYNPDGTLAWAKSAGGPNFDESIGITSLSDNSTVVTGNFGGSATFGPSEINQTILVSVDGVSDIFIARYNPDGTLAWAKRAGGIEADFACGITTLSDNSTVVTGFFGSPDGGSATFGEGEPNETVLASAGEEDIFIARYNPNGALAWAKSAGGIGTDIADEITTLSDNSIVVAGYFSGSATFGQGEPNETVLTSAGRDSFIARFAP